MSSLEISIMQMDMVEKVEEIHRDIHSIQGHKMVREASIFKATLHMLLLIHRDTLCLEAEAGAARASKARTSRRDSRQEEEVEEEAADLAPRVIDLMQVGRPTTHRLDLHRLEVVEDGLEHRVQLHLDLEEVVVLRAMQEVVEDGQAAELQVQMFKDRGEVLGYIKEYNTWNYMEFTYYTEPVTFCIIKNYHSSEIRKSILKELNTLKPHLQEPTKTASASDFSGDLKKSNSGLFLEEFYRENQSKSVILHASRKLFTECIWELKKNNWFYKYIERSNNNATLVSHYKSGDFYDAHEDDGLITAIYYTWDEPKKFEGGDFYFGEFKVPIENNCILIFPSCTEHRVTPVIGNGRWAISQFINNSMRQPNQNVNFYDNFLNVTEFSEVQKRVDQGSWTYKNISTENSNSRFFMMQLTDDPFFREHIKTIIEMRTGKKFNVLRVYANGQAHGQDGEFHQDDQAPNKWTFLLYTNIIPASEIEAWGGETQFKLEDGIRLQLPVPNLGVLFRSDIWHKGMGPSRYINGLRVTVAWKLEEWIS